MRDAVDIGYWINIHRQNNDFYPSQILKLALYIGHTEELKHYRPINFFLCNEGIIQAKRGIRDTMRALEFRSQ